MSDYWTQYWKQGHLTSFGQELSGNYTGSLKNVWTDFFSELPVGAHILDIGTGNGSLLDLALQNDRKFQLVGLDSAELSVPANLHSLENVSFHQKMRAEKLPFEQNAFDTVISQFGIEYADLSKALPELVRVLKPSGHFQLVMHDVKTSIVKPNTKILSAANSLNSQNGALLQVRKLVNAVSKSGPRSFVAENCRAALNETIAAIANNNEEGLRGTNFPSFLKYIMSPNIKLAEKKEGLILFEREMKGQIVRLSDLVNAALSPQRYKLCIDTLLDLKTSIKEDYLLSENDMKIARVIRGLKN